MLFSIHNKILLLLSYKIGNTRMRYVLVPLLFCCFGGNAQTKKIDSLIAVNYNYLREDSLKVFHLTQIFREYARQNNFEKVEEYSNKAIAVAKKLPQTFSLTYIFLRLGLCYHGYSKYIQAADAYNKGIDVARQRGDKATMAGFYLNLGALYSIIPDYAKALEAHEFAVNLYNALGDKQEMSSCYMNIGLIYEDLHQPNKAIEYMQKALADFKTINNGINRGVSVAYEGMANTYMEASEADLVKMGVSPMDCNNIAMDYLKKALLVGEATKDNSIIGSVNNSIGQVYEKMGNASMAFKYYQTALGAIEKETDKLSLGNMLFTLGNYYYHNSAYTESLFYLNKSLQIGKQTGLLIVQQKALEKMSKVHERAGHFDTAFNFYQQYIIIRDSVFNKEKEKEITRKQMQLDFGIRENEYKLMQQITDGKLHQQVLLATQQQQLLTLKQQQLQLISKEKDLQQLAYLKNQEALQNEKQLQASLLQKSTLQSKYDKEVRDKQIAKQQLQIKYDEKVKIFLSISMGFLVLIAFLVYYNQLQTKKLNRIISKQKKELEQLGNVKDKIFSVVSHDMRTPVNALIAFIQLLENNQISLEKLHLYAGELKNQLTHTTHLMENLLNWAASQMQGFKPNITTLYAIDVTDDLVKSIESQAASKGVTINNKISNDVQVLADKDMLALILRNLIGNAVKYSAINGVIELNATKNNGQTIFSVKDNGGGITEKKLLQINANSATSIESSAGTQNEKGTGLGLMLSKTFADIMKGNIQAKNTVNKGCEFLLTLPNKH